MLAGLVCGVHLIGQLLRDCQTTKLKSLPKTIYTLFMSNLTDGLNVKMLSKYVTVSKGDVVVLSVNATGVGKDMFTYQWKKVGSDSLPDTASGGNSTQLTITSISPSDSGMYYCIVMNKWGNMVQSDNATVNVLCELINLYCKVFTQLCCESCIMYMSVV